MPYPGEGKITRSLLKNNIFLSKVQKHFEVRELVTIGTFAALLQTSSLLIALMTGGMNPLGLLLKNVVYTTLLLVALTKIGKFGTLTLFGFVASLFSIVAMGSGIILLLPKLLAAMFAEGVLKALGGYKSFFATAAGVLVFEFLSKGMGIGVSWLVNREQPAMIIMAGIFVAIGSIGSCVGIFTGKFFLKELRHAGIVRR